MADGINITAASVIPNVVNTGGSFIVSVEVVDPNIWLIDSQELFMTDSTGAYLLVAEA